jgi:hypothetical protein
MTDLEQEAQVRQSVENIADRAALKAVKETFLLLGVDVSDPIAAQEQFAILRKLAQPRTLENLDFLESWHVASEVVKDTGWRTVVKVIVTAGLGLLAVMTKEYWLAHLPWKF